jgi:CheY-like chemotaxis protein
MGAKKARILVACVRRAYTRLFAILSGRELAFVDTLAEAQAALKAGGFDLVLIGLYFDESRMFDLLRHIRADEKYDRVPVVCFRGVTAPDGQSQLGLEGVGAACDALRASAFLDLLAFPDDATGNAALRKTIEDFLARGQSVG